MARRPLAAALILGASALVLTGCLPMPPAAPVLPPTSGPTEPTESSDPAEPGTTDAPTESSEPSASSEPSEPSEPSDGAFDFTVDDGAGDTWSFTVTGVEDNPPMDSGSPEPGTYFVGILFDGEHVEGTADFDTCFDFFVVGSDGVEYDWRDTIGVTAQDDIFFADSNAFTQARAAVQLPEGVEPDQVIVRTRFGPGEEIVLDVE
ncbi:hypothetical protein [Agrococcus citreus]|uniref:Uncharacterized protein n=1 Tax=Agrococcus citreus TaxID=84643 RepID=A0ABP4JGG0_9MICO